MNWCYFRLLLFPFVFIAETAFVLTAIAINLIDAVVFNPIHGAVIAAFRFMGFLRHKWLGLITLLHACIANTPSPSWYIGGAWEEPKDETQ